MVDNKLKPWLLEVNAPPALAVENEIDKRVKPQMIADML
jgi:hypothetical protein